MPFVGLEVRALLNEDWSSTDDFTGQFRFMAFSAFFIIHFLFLAGIRLPVGEIIFVHSALLNVDGMVSYELIDLSSLVQ